jgi:hypothetical protein
MEKQTNNPSLWQDARALAKLYREIATVAWERVRWGPEGQAELAETAFRTAQPAEHAERELVSAR